MIKKIANCLILILTFTGSIATATVLDKKQLNLPGNFFKNAEHHVAAVKNKFSINEGLVVQEFGTVSSNTTVQLNVAEDDLSVTLSGVSSNLGDVIGVSKIIDPDGLLVYDLQINGENVSVTGQLTNEPLINQGEVAMFLPIYPSDFGQLKVGNYEVTLINAEGNDILNVKAVFKKKSDLAQQIDINFMVFDRNSQFIEPEYLTTFFNDITDQLNDMLNPHNLSVGNLQYQIASANQRQQFSAPGEADFIDVCEVLSDDFGIGRAINIALVESIRTDQGGTAGVALASPGTVLNSDSRLNCVFASQRAYGDNIFMHAGNFLHETAHYLSFPHTTEGDGETFDHFNDTAECPKTIYDTNNDGEITDHECGVAGGADNFMFYAGHPDFAPFHVSQEQASIMKAHPYFYPAQAEGQEISPVMTGSWYDSEQSGHGFMIEILPDNRILAAWYVFDAAGNQAWLIGVGNYSGSEATLTVSLTENGVFPPDFDPNNITRTEWGTLNIKLNSCNSAEATWQTDFPGFSSGNIELQRLTIIDGMTCE